MGLEHIPNIDLMAEEAVRDRRRLTREASTNTELHVSDRPRNPNALQRTPQAYENFPSRLTKLDRRNVVSQYIKPPQKTILSSAHSSLDIISSTKLDFVNSTPNFFAKSLDNVNKDKSLYPPNDCNRLKSETSDLKRNRAVRRVASRLYRTENNGIGQMFDGCVGPEFIVRASHPNKKLNLSMRKETEKQVTVILINGQKFDVACDPESTTAGQIFQSIIKEENYDNSFMLGMAVLRGGDFVFLPDDYKIRKVAPDGWFSKLNSKRTFRREKIADDCPSFKLFIRIKFYLPTNIANNVKGGPWKQRVYLQLRRSIIEGQITSSLSHLIELSGYALHIEFGDYSSREHGLDYFLLEHYLPEGSCSNNATEVQILLKKAHELHKGMSKSNAADCFIGIAQTFKDYGSHFYSAVWATRDGFSRDIWLSVSPKGITLYSRNTCINALPREAYSANSSCRVLLQSLPWQNIHSFHFNKKTLHIIPNPRDEISRSLSKYKLKIEDNKSYFIYWLASLHHRFYLRFYGDHDLINILSKELSLQVPKKQSKLHFFTSPRGEYAYPHCGSECSNYQDSYNLAVRGQYQIRRQQRKGFFVNMLNDKKTEGYQNKENEEPKDLHQVTSKLTANKEVQQIATTANDALSSSESFSQPRRHGVKMGTKVFHGSHSLQSLASNQLVRTSTFSDSGHDLISTQSDSDDTLPIHKSPHPFKLNSMQLLPQRNYGNRNEHKVTTSTTDIPQAYVLESPRVYSDSTFNPTVNDTCISLLDKFEEMGCVQGERHFVSAVLSRDKSGILGMQVAEGSDGNVYIRSFTANGPAAKAQKLKPGDQIISVNGQTLLNMEYGKSLKLLQNAYPKVELIVLQNVSKEGISKEPIHNTKPRNLKDTIETVKDTNDSPLHCKSSLANNTNESSVTDNDLINAEALKTINALIKLTKQSVVMRFNQNDSITTPNKFMLQKCLSENKIYDESDTGNYCSSHESTPTKKPPHNFSTFRHKPNRMKRRPLSLHIPDDVDIENDYLDTSDSLREHHNIVQRRYDSSMCRNKPVALPKNFGLGRKWIGPVKYPVTPVKNIAEVTRINERPACVPPELHYLRQDNEQIFL